MCLTCLQPYKRLLVALPNSARMLKGRIFPGKVLLSRRSEPLSPPDYSPRFESEHDEDERKEGSEEVMSC